MKSSLTEDNLLSQSRVDGDDQTKYHEGIQSECEK